MESLIKLFNMWEIQLLVLLSFTLQIFLFLTGSIRQHSTSGFLKLSIWAAYLGADMVAVYTLGLVSRQEDNIIERHIPGETHPLAFFWAPFLLVHLGGQDTITAFAMEDNNLWLRHLLNLVVQVVLAIYVFWKSIGRHRVELLLSGIFVFVVGIIKYGERIWSLKCGSFKSLESSTGHRYEKAELPSFDIEEGIGDGYDSIVCMALRLMPAVHEIFSGYFLISEDWSRQLMIREADIRISEDWSRQLINISADVKKVIKMVSTVLSVMYADLYTKALVIRTRSGIILRCISQISAIVAFAVFHANDKQSYSKIDTAITYSLFVGGFFLELCAMFISMMSPWTWAWLKAQKCDRLARLSWFIFSSYIGWPEEKQLWPKSMGQYTLLSWLTGSGQVRTFSQRVMMMVKCFVDLIGLERKKVFWMSKLLDTEDVDVDKMTMECVANEISHLRDEGSIRSRREWPNLSLQMQTTLLGDFGFALVHLHFMTEKFLSKYHNSGPPDTETNAAHVGVPSGMMKVCQELSRYMIYLLVTQPSMLPLDASAEATLESLHNSKHIEMLKLYETSLQSTEDPFSLGRTIGTELQPTEEVVQELVYMWARLLIYAAGKSRAEMHAAQLSRGGELITFAWLLMSFYKLGDSHGTRIRIINADPMTPVNEIFAFLVPDSNVVPGIGMFLSDLLLPTPEDEASSSAAEITE